MQFSRWCRQRCHGFNLVAASHGRKNVSQTHLNLGGSMSLVGTDEINMSDMSLRWLRARDGLSDRLAWDSCPCIVPYT